VRIRSDLEAASALHVAPAVRRRLEKTGEGEDATRSLQAVVVAGRPWESQPAVGVNPLGPAMLVRGALLPDKD